MSDEGLIPEHIIAMGEAMAARLEADPPDPSEMKDAAPLRAIARALSNRDEAEKELIAAVAAARSSGLSWNAVGMYLGTSGEEARQQYAGLI